MNEHLSLIYGGTKRSCGNPSMSNGIRDTHATYLIPDKALAPLNSQNRTQSVSGLAVLPPAMLPLRALNHFRLDRTLLARCERLQYRRALGKVINLSHYIGLRSCQNDGKRIQILLHG